MNLLIDELFFRLRKAEKTCLTNFYWNFWNFCILLKNLDAYFYEIYEILKDVDVTLGIKKKHT